MIGIRLGLESSSMYRGTNSLLSIVPPFGLSRKTIGGTRVPVRKGELSGPTIVKKRLKDVVYRGRIWYTEDKKDIRTCKMIEDYSQKVVKTLKI